MGGAGHVGQGVGGRQEDVDVEVKQRKNQDGLFIEREGWFVRNGLMIVNNFRLMGDCLWDIRFSSE